MDKAKVVAGGYLVVLLGAFLVAMAQVNGWGPVLFALALVVMLLSILVALMVLVEPMTD